MSDVMVAEAEKRVATSGLNGLSGQVSFMVADCGRPRAYSGGPFDVVFAAWLLDNAPDRQVMEDMFRNVSINLRRGGRFISVTVPPSVDPRATCKEKNRLFPAPNGAGGVVVKILDDVPDGLHILVHGPTEVGEVEIDCYYLRQDVVEEAARAGGLLGPLEWDLTTVPERYLRGEGPGGASLQELTNYAIAPQYGILKIAK